MRHAFHGALSRVFAVLCLVAVFLVPLAAHAQDLGASPSGTLTTGIPWLDKMLVVLAAIGSICSLLSHFVSADSIPGKLISWAALNFGKELKAKPVSITELRPGGFARVWMLALIAVFAISVSACAFISKNFGPTLAGDELNCETAELAPLRDALVPQAVAAIEKAIQDAIGGDVNGAIAQGLGLLESAGKTALGDQWAAVLCAEQVAVNDYERAHADAGVVPGTLQVTPLTGQGMVSGFAFHAPDNSAMAYAAVKAHLAAQPKHPKLN